MKKKTILVAAIAVMLVAALVVGGTLAYFTDKTEAKQNTFTVGNVKIDLTETAWNANESHTLVPGKFYDKNPTITVKKGSQDAYVFLEINMNKYASLINLIGVDAYKNHIGGLGDPNGPYPTYPTYPGFQMFVKMLIENNDLRATVLGRWFEGINHADWEVMNLAELKQAVSGTETQTNAKVLPIILGYKGGAKAGVVSAGTEIKFMEAFGMPKTVTASMFDGEDAYYVGEDENYHSASNFNTNTTNAAGNPVPFWMSFTAYAIQADQIADLNAAYAALFTN